VIFMTQIIALSGLPVGRRHEEWSAGLSWLHHVSDALLGLSLAAIPIVFLLVNRRRTQIRPSLLLGLIGTLLLACGLTHLVEVVLAYQPLYLLSGLLKLATATISVATVVALVKAASIPNDTVKKERPPSDSNLTENTLAEPDTEVEPAQASADRSVAQPAPGHTEANGSPALQPSAAARRVLVVDDNQDSAESLAKLLQMTGHETRTAYDGQAALAAAAAFAPEAILLDIGLPGMDGYEVARRLREESSTRQIVLIAVTGYGGEEDERRSREAGFDFHLTKPVRLNMLDELLNGPATRLSAPRPAT
jgi:CheY-like chemotaxis protein